MEIFEFDGHPATFQPTGNNDGVVTCKNLVGKFSQIRRFMDKSSTDGLYRFGFSDPPTYIERRYEMVFIGCLEIPYREFKKLYARMDEICKNHP